jgi:hypothetical protein
MLRHLRQWFGFESTSPLTAIFSPLGREPDVTRSLTFSVPLPPLGE